MRNSIPTNGHRTRREAIIELYEARVQQKEIARQLGCSPNVVSRDIYEYRVKTGRVVEPLEVSRAADWDPEIAESPSAFRMKNYRKSVAGARAALEAMGQ